jgi:hypothetical protein
LFSSVYTSTFAAVSGTQWVWGLLNGLILDGPSLSGTPRILGNGAALSIAGSTANTAIAIASGHILYFDPTDTTPEGSIAFTSRIIQLSSDGGVLAAFSEDATLLNIYSLPSGTVSNTFSYPFLGQTSLEGFTLSSSGAILEQVKEIQNSGCLLQVTPLSGSPTIWSTILAPPGYSCGSMLFSPNGTLIAIMDGAEFPSNSATIYQNGQQVATVPGAAVGWIDNGRLLVNQYTRTTSGDSYYSGCTIFDPTGVVLANPPLPELGGIQPITSDTVYAPNRNAIYSLSTGQATWTSPYPPDSGNNAGISWIGAIAGPYVVFESEGRVIAVKY